MKLELNHFKPTEESILPPILFVHGMAHGAWAWEENFVPFFTQNGYPCYTLSLRGHGNSDSREKLRWTSLEDYMEDLKWAVDQIGGKPIGVGHSMGGFLLQKYFLKYEGLSAFVGVASVPHTGMWRGALNLLVHFPLAFLKGNITLDTAPFSAETGIVRQMCFTPQTPEELVVGLQKRLQSESYRAFLDMVLLNHHRARKTGTPMLMLHSLHDMVLFENEMKNSATQFGADFKTFDSVGHDMFYDTRWKEVAQYILNWLKEKAIKN